MAKSGLPPGFEIDQTSDSTDQAQLPPGFEVDQTDKQESPSEASALPPGFEIEEQKTDPTSMLSQAGTIAENFAKGLAPGVATAAENKLSEMGVPGLSPEEQVARKEANPFEAGGSEIAGNFALMTALPEIEFAKLGQIGSKAINSAIQMGLISSGDAVSDALLGQGDPSSAVAAHIAGSTALGLLSGGIFGKIEKSAAAGLKALEDTKMGTKLKSIIIGAGHKATFPDEEVVSLSKSALNKMEKAGVDPAYFKTGQKLMDEITGSASGKIAKAGSAYVGERVGGLPGYLAGRELGKHLEKIVDKHLPKATQKYIGDALLKSAASGHINNLSQVIDHATTLGKGVKMMFDGVENIFKSSGNKAVEETVSDKDREKLKDFIEQGGVDNEILNESQQQGDKTQGFAKGGEVENMEKPNIIASIYPSQNVLLSAAKGRVNNYLNMARPLEHQQKLPYDSEMKNPQKDKEYNKVLDLANQPLSILNKVKSGELSTKDLGHFTAMYPELHQELSKKITKRITEGQLKKEKKPPYKIRQSLSLFLGADLDSTLTQPNLAAVQAVFAQQRAQKQQATASSSALSKMDDNLRTPEQGRLKRQSKN